MSETGSTMLSILENQAEELRKRLIAHNLMSDEDAEAFAYGLLHTAESLATVYGTLIPNMLREPDISAETMESQVQDIREEFRHISYHIHDGKLTYL